MTISRQLKWQRKKTEQGLCRICSKRSVTKGYCKKHKEIHDIYAREWIKDNPEQHKESMRKWRENNPEYMRAYSKQWRKDNPDYHKQWREKQRTVTNG